MKAYLGMVLAVACSSSMAVAGPILWERQFDDVPLCLEAVPDGGGLVVGFDSGRLVGLLPESKGFREAWSAKLDGSVLKISVGRSAETEVRVVASTDLGQVQAFQIRDGKATQRWSWQGVGAIGQLCILPETVAHPGLVIAGGSAQRLTALYRGKPRWERPLTAKSGGAYINGLASLDSSIYAAIWAEQLADVQFKDGDCRQVPVGTGFSEVLTILGHPSIPMPLRLGVGGNNGILFELRQDGEVLCEIKHNRCLRVCAQAAVGDDLLCACGSAGGDVTVHDVGREQALKRSSVDGVVRQLAILKTPERPQVIAATEEGQVAPLNKAWACQAADVVRCLVVLGDLDQDGFEDLAAASLDGSVFAISGAAKGEFKAPGRGPKLVKGTPRPRPPAAAQPADRVPIMLYHDIPPESHWLYSVSLADFTAQMDWLVAAGYTAVDLDHIADWLAGKATLPAKPICITIDGPYDAHHTHVMDVLRNRGLHATLYMTSDWVGLSNRPDWHQLRELQASGVIDIENHSVTHASFTQIPPDAVLFELKACSDSITRHLGRRPRHHAYPAGAYNNDVIKILRDKGFTTATIVRNRHAVPGDDPLALPRYTMKNTTTLEQFKTFVLGQ